MSDISRVVIKQSAFGGVVLFIFIFVSVSVCLRERERERQPHKEKHLIHHHP